MHTFVQALLMHVEKSVLQYNTCTYSSHAHVANVYIISLSIDTTHDVQHQDNTSALCN